MTSNNLLEKTNNQKQWLNIAQLLLFTSAIILLSVLNLSHSSVDIKRPVVLLAASVFVLFNFKKSREISIIQKVILLYIIEMFFNQLSGKSVHMRPFSIDMSLIAMLPLGASFACCRFQKSKVSFTETNDLLKSWAVVFAVITIHMLFLFLLLKNIYGYGYNHNFAVLANLCLYFLVFVFSWEQLQNIHLRRITAIFVAVFFIVIMVRKF